MADVQRLKSLLTAWLAGFFVGVFGASRRAPCAGSRSFACLVRYGWVRRVKVRKCQPIRCMGNTCDGLEALFGL